MYFYGYSIFYFSKLIQLVCALRQKSKLEPAVHFELRSSWYYVEFI